MYYFVKFREFRLFLLFLFYMHLKYWVYIIKLLWSFFLVCSVHCPKTIEVFLQSNKSCTLLSTMTSFYHDQSKDKLLLNASQILFMPRNVNFSPEARKTLIIMVTTDCIVLECLPCNGDMWQAETAAAAWSRADLQFMFSCSLQEHLVTTHLLQHQDQELEHHNCKVATKR